MNNQIPPQSGWDEKERHAMTKSTVLSVFAALLMFALAPQVRANGECSTADLKGDYSFVASGTINVPGLPVGPFAAAGKTHYHGDGTADGVIQVSLNGNQLFSKWTAIYTVDSSSCTITKTITLEANGVKLDFFITAGEDFRELRFIATDPGTAITGTARKQ
jgi:hypothetical protein